MSRNCSQCGHNGHNSRTCGGENHGGGGGGGGGESGIMLFGVRVTEGASFRKSFSMTNLSQYDQPQDPNADVASGYESDDVVHASGSRSRERKRGVAWTEEEHKLFLLGLQKVGKGDWRGISRNFVKTRTPTQVASHAQKYFLRRNNLNRRRRRSSLFDITPDSLLGSTIEEEQLPPQPYLSNNNLGVGGFPISTFPRINEYNNNEFNNKSMENLSLVPINSSIISSISTSPPPPPPPLKLIRPIPVPPSSKIAYLNLNQETPTTEPNLPLSLKLSTTSSDAPSPAASTSTKTHSSSSSSSATAFQAMSGHGDGIISVA